MAASYAFDFVFHFNYHGYVLTVWSFCDRSKRKVSASMTRRRVVKQEGASKIFREGEPIAVLFFLALVRPLEYMTPYFGTGAGRFIYFVCMCCAVLLGYSAMKGWDEKGAQKGLAQNDSGAQRGRRTGISRMEFGLAASRCIQIVFFPFPQDNFLSDIRFRLAMGKRPEKWPG